MKNVKKTLLKIGFEEEKGFVFEGLPIFKLFYVL